MAALNSRIEEGNRELKPLSSTLGSKTVPISADCSLVSNAAAAAAKALASFAAAAPLSPPESKEG